MRLKTKYNKEINQKGKNFQKRAPLGFLKVVFSWVGLNLTPYPRSNFKKN